MYARAFIHKTTGRYLHSLGKDGDYETVGKVEYGKIWLLSSRVHDTNYNRFIRNNYDKLIQSGFQEVVVDVEEELYLQIRREQKQESLYMRGIKI